MSRYFSFFLVTLATLICGDIHAEIIKDYRNSLAFAPDYLNVHIDEFYMGAPTTWWVRDGAKDRYDNFNDNIELVRPTGEVTGRQSFWVPRSQPTFYLWGGMAPPNEENFGPRGLTYHVLDVEALAGANVVTVDPSNVPGRFAYSWSGGSREVDLLVTSGVPEPSSAVLGLLGLAAIIRRRHA